MGTASSRQRRRRRTARCHRTVGIYLCTYIIIHMLSSRQRAVHFPLGPAAGGAITHLFRNVAVYVQQRRAALRVDALINPPHEEANFPFSTCGLVFVIFFFFPSSKIVPAPVSWPDGMLQRRATDGAEPWDGRRFWHPEPSTTDGVIRTFAGSYGAATCTNSRYSYRQTDIIILLPTCMLVRVLVHMYTSVGYLLFIDF